MTSHPFVLYLASYQDLAEDLAELSLSLQDDKRPVSAVWANVEVAQVNLMLMRDESREESPKRHTRNNSSIRGGSRLVPQVPMNLSTFDKKMKNNIPV